MYARERRLDYATTRAAARVATNSAYTATAIQERYGRTAIVVPMGVADKLRDCRPDTRRQGFLLSVGALTAAKGHALVIRVAAALPKPRPVTIVAPRPAPSEASGLLALARDLGVQATVKVAIADAELANLYASAHATLYLAREEPLGLVALEAQAMGCPVIVAAEGGLPETIEDGVTGWSVPRDVAAAAQAVSRLDDEDEYRRMSAAARDRGARFTWAASAAQIADLLTGVPWSRSAVGESFS
jgi:glycosyltransferase involved in cell wall biosynthesis